MALLEKEFYELQFRSERGLEQQEVAQHFKLSVLFVIINFLRAVLCAMPFNAALYFSCLERIIFIFVSLLRVKRYFVNILFLLSS